MPPESARRVGHPAPFPVELPEQLIRLYTFKNDLVLDPFMGSGSALVAAALLDRRYIGYDVDAGYVDIARQRVADALADRATPPSKSAPTPNGGMAAGKLARAALVEAGFTVVSENRLVPKTGVRVSFEATNADGDTWLFDVPGPFTSRRGGLVRSEVVWRALGRAHALRGRTHHPLVLLTTDLPKPKSEGDTALRSAGPDAFFDAIDLLATDGMARLERYARGGRKRPLAGFWTETDLARRLL
jgi:hypothetical protein